MGPGTHVYPLTRLPKGLYGPSEVVKNKPMEHGVIERVPLSQEGAGGGSGGSGGGGGGGGGDGGDGSGDGSGVDSGRVTGGHSGPGLSGGAPRGEALAALARAAEECARALEVAKADKEKVLSAVATIRAVREAYSEG